jgi:hypothetical protein
MEETKMNQCNCDCEDENHEFFHKWHEQIYEDTQKSLKNWEKIIEQVKDILPRAKKSGLLKSDYSSETITDEMFDILLKLMEHNKTVMDLNYQLSLFDWPEEDEQIKWS